MVDVEQPNGFGRVEQPFFFAIHTAEPLVKGRSLMRHTWFAWTVALAAGLSTWSGVQAEVRLPKIFGDHMVLQRDQPIPVWGWADAGAKVTVQLGDGEAATTHAGDDGRWQVRLAPRAAGGPLQLTVSGTNVVKLTDVLVGEVWLCSGQSNMEFQVSGTNNAAAEIAAAKFPRIRHIQIPRRPAGFPAQDVDAQWTVCTPDTVPTYTAVGYFFGRYLHQQLDVPVGLINASWGGTLIAPWTPPCGFAQCRQVPALAKILRQVQMTNPTDPQYKARLAQYIDGLNAWLIKARETIRAPKPLAPPPEYPAALRPLTSHQSPTTLYNGMIHPLVPFAIRGAIWYQGESNHRDGMLYYEKMKALIGGWRDVWHEGAFPFYYVQIAPFEYGNESPGILPTLWEAQAKALDIPNTGMAVIHDIGNLTNIHPRNKQEVGRRLALIALARTYGRKELVYSGPTFKSLAVEDNRLRVTFDHVGGGLIARDGKPLNWFEIVGPDTDFEKADARIDGATVVLSAPKVKHPVAVRFAWHKLAEPNLANKEGLPAVPFRAGDVPKRDWLSIKIDEAKNYTLVYDVDLSKLGPTIKYDVDRSATVQCDFDRIAYFLELRKTSEPTRYLYVSLDAFTKDIGKIGIPTAASGAKFQMNVTNMNVISNMPGVVNGTGIQDGNIEFWPHNYGAINSAKVPNASDSVYDFGDQCVPPVDGYGSMQIHDHKAKQTLLAINHWNNREGADIGIGNSPGQTRDWTFTGSASQYESKRLRVLVRQK